MELSQFMEGFVKRNPGEPEFYQAVQEVAASVIPYINDHPKYIKARILERLSEPDRIIIFRVCWEDDRGKYRVNRGYRVQHSNAIGPYKGGLRFHPSVNLSVLKFLAFEQTFKNSLTTLPMGSAKGGSNFDPKGKSEREIMRFCQAFMTELCKHIGNNIDIPAGDIGVGTREISFLFGQWKRLRNEFTGALTGKGLEFGGSHIRKEATGYGCAYFMESMLKHRGDTIKGKTCVVSGAGNVAVFTAEKLMDLGAKVVTLSDSSGTIYDKDGLNEEKLEFVKDLKLFKKGRIAEYSDKFDCEYHEGKKPWGVKCDLAFPCATENELFQDDAKELIKNGCIAVAEGANMPCTPEAIRVFQEERMLYAPGKASNAGGVAVSGLEMTQNTTYMAWSGEDVDLLLKGIMADIHQQCIDYGVVDGGYIDYAKGANLAGFKKVADAMMAYGVL
ncbi:Glutamate dehydrogenase, NADP-specific [Nitrospina gracilis 3/211]|uniref:Glutamate dehydrogenase n=1 Tax=Nitrospina gracilis (strain 3/211) TaxID=1266370 RepID=M1ZCF4_NITG3|nr:MULTISPECIES: NADP-specific glutamate dehydrogenase [Nitrospina]MCF8723899.1 glutamate dehydrogenase (NADP+) [Nitrospina sp. Nb-3]CCQ91021.1 Glutamate dehydrogenase, NADP-specific [Nitrospina gracilis 3/211]